MDGRNCPELCFKTVFGILRQNRATPLRPNAFLKLFFPRPDEQLIEQHDGDIWFQHYDSFHQSDAANITRRFNEIFKLQQSGRTTRWMIELSNNDHFLELIRKEIMDVYSGVQNNQSGAAKYQPMFSDDAYRLILARVISDERICEDGKAEARRIMETGEPVLFWCIVGRLCLSNNTCVSAPMPGDRQKVTVKETLVARSRAIISSEFEKLSDAQRSVSSGVFMLDGIESGDASATAKKALSVSDAMCCLVSYPERFGRKKAVLDICSKFVNDDKRASSDAPLLIYVDMEKRRFLRDKIHNSFHSISEINVPKEDFWARLASCASYNLPEDQKSLIVVADNMSTDVEVQRKLMTSAKQIHQKAPRAYLFFLSNTWDTAADGFCRAEFRAAAEPVMRALPADSSPEEQRAICGLLPFIQSRLQPGTLLSEVSAQEKLLLTTEYFTTALRQELLNNEQNAFTLASAASAKEKKAFFDLVFLPADENPDIGAAAIAAFRGDSVSSITGLAAYMQHCRFRTEYLVEEILIRRFGY